MMSDGRVVHGNKATHAYLEVLRGPVLNLVSNAAMPQGKVPKLSAISRVSSLCSSSYIQLNAWWDRSKFHLIFSMS